MLRSTNRDTIVVEPDPQGGETFGKLEQLFEVSASAPGQTKVVYLIIIHLEQDQASHPCLFSFQKIMKTL